MGGIMESYHPTAKTTVKIRKEIKENKNNLTITEQAKKYNVTYPTIVKWRNRSVFEDAPHGAIKPKKSISDLEEYIICEIRKTALLPLDDLLDVVTELGIKISRSALDRALARNGLSNLKKYIKNLTPKIEKGNKKFKDYQLGYIHVDIKYLPKIDGKRTYLYVAIDRATRLVFVKIYDDKTSISADNFLKTLIEFFPFKISKILTDNGKEFTDRFNNKSKKPTGNHKFDKTCSSNDIEHRLTAPYTPKTNGMVERVNGKVTQNILNKIKFNNILDMKQVIFQYIYNYNNYIKHSSIGRKTPMEMLEALTKNKEKKELQLTENISNFKERLIDSFCNYKMGCDTLKK
jgi:transposase-like protein